MSLPLKNYGVSAGLNPHAAEFCREPILADNLLTSIIILTCNQLEHTHLCLDSIMKHTPEPHEIIMVDNGSTDGTVEFLREYMSAHEHVRVIANASNRGFAAGNNQGMSIAKGKLYSPAQQ